MKNFLLHVLVLFVRCVLWFRYKVTVKGLENINKINLNKPAGTLFLPTHPAVFVDPLLAAIAPFPNYIVRPLVVEYMYYLPVAHSILKFVNALPIPNFDVTSNSLKKRRNDEIMNKLINDLKNGDHFLIYPAGHLKNNAREEIGGASGVRRILKEAPECNVVLMRVKGLWGSSFSRYYTGRTPPMFKTIMQGVMFALKNLIFFTPRRHVIIELEPAPKDFPWTASKLKLNSWLENWYNQPDGLTKQEGDFPGDSLIQVSYSMWGEKYLEVNKEEDQAEKQVDLDKVPQEVREKIFKKIAELTDKDPATIKPEMQLSFDLGMDSLDIAELVLYLQDEFEIRGAPATDMTSVKKVLGLATGQIDVIVPPEQEEVSEKKWHQPLPHDVVHLYEGETIHEVFLNACADNMHNYAAADMRSGPITFGRMKLGAILFAEFIRNQPGKHVGIMLPASVGATLAAFAVQLAGKIPLMINWTQGPLHLEQVSELSQVEVVLSSWAFLDRLGSVDLDGIEDKLVMLEDVRRSFGIKDKLKAAILSKRPTHKILSHFGSDKVTKQDTAVLLFTSGTESLPKGVPLSHSNIISMIGSGLEMVTMYKDDVFFGMLPPFHAFGYSIAGAVPILCGYRVAFHPDPTDGIALAKGVEKWGATISCGAPTFLRGMLKSAKGGQLQTLRLCITGAEAAPPELFELAKTQGLGDVLREGYGITECSPILTVNGPDVEPGGVGLPLSCVDLCIVHPDTFERLPQGERGLLLAKGPNVFSGYLNPGISSPFVTFEGNQWYNTGDLGFLDEKGRLILAGRLKRFVKIGGEMVSLGAVEHAIQEATLEQGMISKDDEGPNVAVCAREEEGQKTRLFLFTTFPLPLDDANKMLREKGFSILVKLSGADQLEEIPIMGSGKIYYRKIESEFMQPVHH